MVLLFLSICKKVIVFKDCSGLSFKVFLWKIIFVLWITYNGINEHFRGTIYQKLSYIGLMGLLSVNSFLIPVIS
jgi:hypothetical protein